MKQVKRNLFKFECRGKPEKGKDKKNEKSHAPKIRIRKTVLL